MQRFPLAVCFILAALLPARASLFSDDDDSISIESPVMVQLYSAASLSDLLQTSPTVKDPGQRWGEMDFDSPYAGWLSERSASAFAGRPHVRGGRAGELAYVLDGMDITDPVTGQPFGRVPLAFLESAKLEAGFLPAESGGALSGLVRASTPGIGDTYRGAIGVSGNDWPALGMADKRSWMTSDAWNDGAACVSASISGPEPLTEQLLPAMGAELPGDVCFSASGEHLRTGGGEEGRYGWGFNQWTSSWTGAAKVIWRPSLRTEFTLTGWGTDMSAGWYDVRNTWEWSRYEDDYYIAPDTVLPGSSILYGLPTRFWNGGTMGLGMRQEIAPHLGMEMHLSHYSGSFSYKIRNDPEGPYVTDWLGEGWSDAQWQAYDPGLIYDASGFIRSGTSQWARRETDSERTTAGLNVAVQANPQNTLRVGGDISLMSADHFGVRIDTTGAQVDRWSASPLMGSVYIADSIRLGEMTMDAGLRLEMMDPATDDLEYGTTHNTDESIPVKKALCPRISTSYRLSPADVLTVSYGHSSQMPRMDYLYGQAVVPAMVNDAVWPLQDTGMPLQGNPDLPLIRSVNYQVSYDRELGQRARASATFYYREMSDLTGTEPVYLSGDSIPDYYAYSANGSAEATGLELALSSAPSESSWLYGDIAWSWSVAKGTSSSPLLDYRANLESLYAPDDDHPLDWDQRHTVVAALGLQAPGDQSELLRGLSAELRWRYGSGYPYTHNDPEDTEGEINNWRYPETMRTDLRIQKRINTGPLTITPWFGCQNLFDRRNIDFIADVDWYMAYQETDPSSDDADPTGPLDNQYAYSQPRRIALGLDFSW